MNTSIKGIKKSEGKYRFRGIKMAGKGTIGAQQFVKKYGDERQEKNRNEKVFITSKGSITPTVNRLGSGFSVSALQYAKNEVMGHDVSVAESLQNTLEVAEKIMQNVVELAAPRKVERSIEDKKALDR